jgi:hypothetical protein
VGGHLGLATSMAIMLALLAVVRWRYLASLDPTLDQGAAAAFFDILLHFLRSAIWLLGGLGLATAAVAAVTRSGSWFRREWAATRVRLETGWLRVVSRWPWTAQVGASVGRHRTGLLATLIAACCLAIILLDRWNNLTVVWVVIVALIAAIGLVAIWILPRVAQRRQLDATAFALGSEPVRSAQGTCVVAQEPGVAAAAPNPLPALGALVRDLSDDDLRVLLRLAVVLRDTR